MSKSSLKIWETPDVDHKINPDERQTSKVHLEETPMKFSVSTTNSVEVLYPLTPSQTTIPPLLEKITISKNNFIHQTYGKLIYSQPGNKIY